MNILALSAISGILDALRDIGKNALRNTSTCLRSLGNLSTVDKFSHQCSTWDRMPVHQCDSDEKTFPLLEKKKTGISSSWKRAFLSQRPNLSWMAMRQACHWHSFSLKWLEFFEFLLCLYFMWCICDLFIIPKDGHSEVEVQKKIMAKTKFTCFLWVKAQIIVTSPLYDDWKNPFYKNIIEARFLKI